MATAAREAILLAKELQKIAPKSFILPSEGFRPQSQQVIPHALVSSTRAYIERIVFQINGCYEHGWFDGCAVMMRRMLETLIIECFESHGIDEKIKNPVTGDFLYLAELISRALAEPSWNLARNTKRALPKLKNIGDQSAHSRRYVAHREDIDGLASDFRSVCQELIYLARLK
jgi:hypothetical protein